MICLKTRRSVKQWDPKWTNHHPRQTRPIRRLRRTHSHEWIMRSLEPSSFMNNLYLTKINESERRWDWNTLTPENKDRNMQRDIQVCVCVCVRESVCLCVCSVAAQEEGVAGRSSQTVAQSTDSRSMFHRTALAHITLRRERQTEKVKWVINSHTLY